MSRLSPVDMVRSPKLVMSGSQCVESSDGRVHKRSLPERDEPSPISTSGANGQTPKSGRVRCKLCHFWPCGGHRPVPRRLGHRRQTTGRVRHHLQVHQRGLHAGVSQPPAEVIERYPAQQQVASITVPQGVGPDVPAVGQLASVNRPQRRLLDPPPGRGPGNADQCLLPTAP